jgi:c-di-GMP-binding flagellar brake protein YcgR
MPVRVYDHQPDVLTLVLMLDDGPQLESAPPEPVSLEYVSPRGLVRFQGRAVLEGRDLVSFQVASQPEVLQRRDFVRVDAVQPVVLAAADGHASVQTHALDISGGGMLLTGPTWLELDSLLRFSLHLEAGDAPVEGMAKVVRAGADGRRALVFEQISAADRQRLIHFVFERQRTALAKGRIG